jgi:hypothetical protein
MELSGFSLKQSVLLMSIRSCERVCVVRPTAFPLCMQLAFHLSRERSARPITTFGPCFDDILTLFEPGDARLSRSDWPESIQLHPSCKMSVCAAFGTALRTMALRTS